MLLNTNWMVAQSRIKASLLVYVCKMCLQRGGTGNCPEVSGATLHAHVHKMSSAHSDPL